MMEKIIKPPFPKFCEHMSWVDSAAESGYKRLNESLLIFLVKGRYLHIRNLKIIYLVEFATSEVIAAYASGLETQKFFRNNLSRR
jgi:hypothetical protein